MFGMGILEILFIVVIAIIFLGPEKFPTALVELTKFFNTIKTNVNIAKQSLEEELNIQGLKDETINLKKEFEDEKLNIDNELQELEKGLRKNLKKEDKEIKKFKKEFNFLDNKLKKLKKKTKNV